MKTFSDAITFIGDNLSFLLDKTVQQLELSGAAIGVSLLIAIPIGLWLGHIHRGASFAITASNAGPALPRPAAIAIRPAGFGLGFVNRPGPTPLRAIPPLLTHPY